MTKELSFLKVRNRKIASTVTQRCNTSPRMELLIDKGVRTYKRQLYLEMNSWMLDNLEYVPIDKEGTIKDKEENWTERFKDDESDEDFQWVESNESSTYISFINTTRKPIKKGD